jgi:excisionase family DNA binding protein
MQSRYLDCMHADSTVLSPTGGNAAPAAIAAAEQIAYNVPHAAKILDLSERQMWTKVRNGEIASFKMGASRRITRAALLAYIDSLQVAA